MKLAQMVLGALQENCYLCVEESTGEGFIVDPGIPAAELPEAITEMGITNLTYILLTHGHYDHVSGVAFLKENFPDVKIVMGKEEQSFINDPNCRGNGYPQYGFTTIIADELVEDGSSLSFADTEIHVIATPGHTPGGVCYCLQNVLFSGDTLFCKTYGRTDLQGGDMEAMKDSLQKLGNMEGDYNVLPGHGPATSLNYEREYNRYMRKLSWS